MEADELEQMIAARRRALASGDVAGAPMAALELGQLLAHRGQSSEAEQAFQEAIASDDSVAAPAASLYLALLISQQGRRKEAEREFRRAIASRHGEVVPAASFWFGRFLADQGRYDEAERSFEQAIASQDETFAPEANFHLGELLVRQERDDEAESRFRDAIRSRHADAAPGASFHLGLLLANHRRDDEARDAFGQAIASGHRGIAPAARQALAELEAEAAERRHEPPRRLVAVPVAVGALAGGFAVGVLLHGTSLPVRHGGDPGGWGAMVLAVVYVGFGGIVLRTFLRETDRGAAWRVIVTLAGLAVAVAVAAVGLLAVVGEPAALRRVERLVLWYTILEPSPRSPVEPLDRYLVAPSLCIGTAALFAASAGLGTVVLRVQGRRLTGRRKYVALVASLVAATVVTVLYVGSAYPALRL
jgi:TolA-binding protein